MLTDKVLIMFLSPDPDPDHLQTCRQVDVLSKRSNLILHAFVYKTGHCALTTK